MMNGNERLEECINRLNGYKDKVFLNLHLGRKVTDEEFKFTVILINDQIQFLKMATDMK